MFLLATACPTALSIAFGARIIVERTLAFRGRREHLLSLFESDVRRRILHLSLCPANAELETRSNQEQPTYRERKCSYLRFYP